MGLTAIPEVEDYTDSGNAEPASAPSRRHSMPAVPHSHAVGAAAKPVLAARSTGGGVAQVRGGGTSIPVKAHSDTDSRHRGGGVWGTKGTKGLDSEFRAPTSRGDCTSAYPWQEEEDEASGRKSQNLPLLTASEMMHKRWQNPIECLSLTLEEVTHIRSVLTKAELESLISHSDLYNLVSKSKVCFTCKTTRFTLFGEWGTKCKFCRRTVCSKCMRKMHVPTEHFKNIPVYTLSPTPLSKEAQTFIQNYVKTGSSPQPASATASTTSWPDATPPTAIRGKPSVLDQQKGKRPLQRSQSMTLPTKKSSVASGGQAKAPVMSICCDCKGMIMEIIRASKTSLAILQPSVAVSESSGGASPLSSPSVTSQSSTSSASSSNY